MRGTGGPPDEEAAAMRSDGLGRRTGSGVDGAEEEEEEEDDEEEDICFVASAPRALNFWVTFFASFARERAARALHAPRLDVCD
jgi:hypothetical protein